MYVRRDENGRIDAVSRYAEPAFTEHLPTDHPELLAFLSNGGARGRLASTDLELVRVLEDLIEVLVQKEVIRFTDLPSIAQNKLLERRHSRVRLREGLNLVGAADEEEGAL